MLVELLLSLRYLALACAERESSTGLHLEATLQGHLEVCSPRALEINTIMAPGSGDIDVCRWEIGWRTPSLIWGFYVLGEQPLSYQGTAVQGG